MLLAHIDDLLRSPRNYDYSFQLYEAMVHAWLDREVGCSGGAERLHLQEFCEKLAVNLVVNASSRGAEHIPPLEIYRLATEWAVEVDGWKLTGRSLLNRDAEGNFKFAHRSIMEFLYVTHYISNEDIGEPEAWTEQMRLFYVELMKHAAQTGMAPARSGTPKFELAGFPQIYRLRSRPKLTPKPQDLVPDSTVLSSVGHGHKHCQQSWRFRLYQRSEKSDLTQVVDFATHLIWEVTASEQNASYEDAIRHVDQLNGSSRPAAATWRLPTTEEILSIVEFQGGLYSTHPELECTPSRLWSADRKSEELVWVLDLSKGIGVIPAREDYAGVVAVREL